MAEFGAGFGGKGGHGVSEFGCLLLDGFDDVLVAVADVDVDELGGPVDEAFAIGIPKVNAFGAGHGDGSPLALGFPSGEGVFFVLLDYFCMCTHFFDLMGWQVIR